AAGDDEAVQQHPRERMAGEHGRVVLDGDARRQQRRQRRELGGCANRRHELPGERREAIRRDDEHAEIGRGAPHRAASFSRRTYAAVIDATRTNTATAIADPWPSSSAWK